jgi:hypothetical protein
MKGYKGFDKDLKCRGFQYEIGKTYKAEGKIKIGINGFHFCKNPMDICDFDNYGNLLDCRYCEVEASGEIIEEDELCVCSEIKIVREIPLWEFLSLVNQGNENKGWNNNGDRNDGDFNIGDDNKGCCNTGYLNEGNYNLGISNIGNSNIGYNNSGCAVFGIFSTDCGCIVFNKYTEKKWLEVGSTEGYMLLCCCMSEHRMPSKEELDEIKKLPNFDEAVMRELILGKESKK